jgi:hypothetical protein
MSPPTYSPPALHFLIIAFDYSCALHVCTFTCTTDVPCHLTAHISDQRPVIRRIPYQKRGADMEASSVTCFVETKTIDQDEAGDTTHHTFQIPMPIYDHLYYWYFTGTQGALPTKSISQIFWHSCPKPTGALVTTKFYSDPASGHTTVDGTAFRYVANQTWPQIHDGPGTHRLTTGTVAYVALTSDSTSGRWYQLMRAKFTFDLTSIPVGSTIQAAAFHFYCQSKLDALAIGPSYALFTAPAPPYNNVRAADYPSFGTTPISDTIPYYNIVVSAWNHLTIDPLYYPLLIPGALVALGMRDNHYDAPNFPPPWKKSRTSRMGWWTSDGPYPALKPYLEITYQEP